MAPVVTGNSVSMGGENLRIHNTIHIGRCIQIILILSIKTINCIILESPLLLTCCFDRCSQSTVLFAAGIDRTGLSDIEDDGNASFTGCFHGCFVRIDGPVSGYHPSQMIGSNTKDSLNLYNRIDNNGALAGPAGDFGGGAGI